MNEMIVNFLLRMAFVRYKWRIFSAARPSLQFLLTMCFKVHVFAAVTHGTGTRLGGAGCMNTACVLFKTQARALLTVCNVLQITLTLNVPAFAARFCKPCTLKLHYFEKFLAQNLQHQPQLSQPNSAAPKTREPVAALMTGLHIADIYMVRLLVMAAFQEQNKSGSCLTSSWFALACRNINPTNS